MTTLPPEIEANYEVLQTMGGGMGTVYKVRHRHFSETRIIKVMQASLAGNQELKDRFTAEAKRGKQLKHRNIAEVLDFQIGSNGNPYLVMEYIEGVNVRDEFARRGGRLDPPLVVTIGVQTLAALGYLHSKNLIHRDISPDNLMIARDTDGSPLIKLIDLGIAKSLEDNSILTQTGNFLGKISYASPEQFGGVVDARSDFYSLGVVLYELLTAQKPITGATTAACIMAHCQTPPRPFSETDPQGRVPEALRAVVLKALAKNPKDRYQTAGEFSAALQGALPHGNAVRTAAAMPFTAAPVPSTLIEKTPFQLPAPSTEIVAPQRHRGAQTIFALIAIAAAVTIIGLAAVILFERQKSQPVARVDAPRTTSATLGQPAGASIAIEAPKPVSVVAQSMQVASSDSAPSLADRDPDTPAASKHTPIAARDLPPVTQPTPHQSPTVAPTPPEPQPQLQPQTAPQPRMNLEEGDRRRKEALALSNAHQWASAVTAWREFIHNYGGVNVTADHAAYYNLGVAYEALEQWNYAADAFEKATLADANINDTNNLLRLGRSYGKIGRWSDAEGAYKRVLQIDPSNQIARRSLILALEQQPRAR
ncbi:MAG TPA: serine/threonine-protein kinase [Thermoanaerobaculia bacterium]|jgi:serine/threonine-protein kinase|nr:serine/threonine-protein kinase [Thermoanaerobaculia bacterium]